MLYKLESLRGFAAIMVLMYHLGISVSTKDLGFVQSSWLFVDFFFILSGFVMALAYENKIKEGLKFKDYFLTRFYRLFPLHAFILILFLPLIGLKYILYNTGFGGTDPSLTENLKTFLTTLFLLNSLGLEGGWNSPSWSISAEFVAYIIFYFIIFFLNSRKKTFIFCISVAISIYFFSYLFFGVFNFFTWDFGFLRSIPGFLLGVSLFIFFSSYSVSGNMFFKELLAVSLIIGSVTLTSTNRAYSYLAILSFIICIYIFSSKEDGLFGKLLNLKLPRLLGTYSYSIYMTHMLVIIITEDYIEHILGISYKSIHGTNAFIINTAIFLTVISISHFTYRSIEKPGRDYGKVITNKFNT